MQPADLQKFSSPVLVSCFGNLRPCFADAWSIAEELVKRGGIHSLAGVYWRSKDRAVRAGIEKVAYRQDSQEALDFMRRVVAAKVDDGEDRYYPLNYLAKRCEREGLKAIATGQFRSQGSMQYASSIELFGACGYRAAIPHLVEEALWDASLNVVEAAQNSLQKLYPGSPADFRSLAAMQQYYCEQAVAEGFRLNCKSKVGDRGK
ncbi:MAG TPA: hypothetical protein VKB88_08300 [Bryobacteraceae bacterium]|nr:hypothetical protein [Bryobacteraceae bacterium]